MSSAKAPLPESRVKQLAPPPPHSRWHLLEQVYRVFALMQQEMQSSQEQQGHKSCVGNLSSTKESKAAIVNTNLVSSMWHPQEQSPCCSYEACCLLELYRPLLTEQDLLISDVRVGLEHIPLLVCSLNYGLLLLTLNEDTPQQLSHDFSFLLQQEKQLRRLKQDLLSSLSKALHLSLEQALALQDCTLVLICLTSCQVSDIVQQVLPKLKNYPRPREAMYLKALFTDQASEVRLRYLKKGAYAQVQQLLADIATLLTSNSGWNPI